MKQIFSDEELNSIMYDDSGDLGPTEEAYLELSKKEPYEVLSSEIDPIALKAHLELTTTGAGPQWHKFFLDRKKIKNYEPILFLTTFSITDKDLSNRKKVLAVEEISTSWGILANLFWFTSQGGASTVPILEPVFNISENSNLSIDEALKKVFEFHDFEQLRNTLANRVNQQSGWPTADKFLEAVWPKFS